MARSGSRTPPPPCSTAARAKRTAAEFAAVTDFLGARVEGGSSSDEISLIASGLVKDLPKLADLLGDAALHPAFPEEELAKHKRQIVSAIIQGKQRPASSRASSWAN